MQEKHNRHYQLVTLVWGSEFNLVGETLSARYFSSKSLLSILVFGRVSCVYLKCVNQREKNHGNNGGEGSSGG